VSVDPDALGFTSVSTVRNARAVALRLPGGSPTYPSSFTIATESYFLSRRLYLYTTLAVSPTAQQFVFFALSSDGQKVVRDTGFVDLDVSVQEAETCTEHCSPRYLEITKGARRLSLDFRFRVGREELDSRAMRDFDRLLTFLRGRRGRLRLIGFSDGSGDAARNVALSLARARTIGAELDARGVHPAEVAGLGGEMPVAPNDDPAGREKNRRVEVWLTDE
jgi:phosphate transport system substrate-binding protein